MKVNEIFNNPNIYMKDILNYGNGKISKKKLMNSIGPEIYIKLRSKINAMEEYRANIIKDRNLEVIYFCGKSGSGKTTAAKYFANRFGYDEFVSGSGDDFLDGYDKEECLILDDFRGGSMRFMELLKMLDNHTNSSVKSRYYNKDLSNCKLIIITSVYPPDQLYEQVMQSGDEPIEQLYRRLKHHYYQINPEDGEIEEMQLEVGKAPTSAHYSIGNINDIYKALGIDINKKDNSMFDVLRKHYNSLEGEL